MKAIMSVLDRQHLITVCAVLRNDNDIVSTFIDQVSHLLSSKFEFYEILLVDNYSSDQTSDSIVRLQESTPNLRLIRLSQIYSTETALTAALDNSIGDFVVVMEPRYDSVELIPDLIEHALQGSDIVVVRQNIQQRYSRLDRLVGEFTLKIASRLIGQPLRIDESRFRVYSRRAVNALAQVRRKRRYLKYANALIGYSQSSINSPHTTDTQRKPVHRLESISLLVDMIVSNSGSPLRITSLIGLFASFLSLLYAIYIILITLLRDNIVEGVVNNKYRDDDYVFHVIPGTHHTF